jgi:flagellar export protein FliJ
MAFRFSLRPILRLRASYERLERLRLLALAAAIVRVREEIAALTRESQGARRRMNEGLALGVMGAEIQFDTVCERFRTDRKQALATQLEELEGQQERQRVAYRAARQKREILENLRERQWNEYRLKQARREQAGLDELHLLGRRTDPPE